MTKWMSTNKFLKTVGKLNVNREVRMESWNLFIYHWGKELQQISVVVVAYFVCLFLSSRWKGEIQVWDLRWGKLQSIAQDEKDAVKKEFEREKDIQYPWGEIYADPDLKSASDYLLFKYFKEICIDFGASFFCVCLPIYAWASTIQDLIYLCWFSFFSLSLFMALREALCPCWERTTSILGSGAELLYNS